MKQFYLLTVALLASFGLSAQVIYVDIDAAPGGDGSSWEQAFTTITAAVDAASGGEQIWIADGTYSEGVSVFISKQLIFLGGFNGTEATPGESNPFMNIATVTGDVNGDDVDGDFENNRTDNIRIFEIDSLIPELFGPGTPSVVFQGLTFTNGQTEPFTGDINTDPVDPSAGGVARSYSPTGFRLCTFIGNNSAFGAGPAFLFGANNSSVESCSFTGNRSSRASVVYGRSVFGPIVVDSEFSMNVTDRGGVMSFGTIGTLVDNCVFEDNTNFANTGRGQVSYLFSEVSDITNCEFINNRADLGTAIYLLASADEEQDPTNHIIDSCFFNGNTGARFGGGFTTLNAGFTLKNSIVQNTVNEGTDALGGFMYVQGDGVPIVIDSTVFDNNRGETGSAIVARGDGTTLNITNSEFSNNNGAQFGGAIVIFANGSADSEDLLQGSPTLNVSNTLFFNNRADLAPGFAGAIDINGNFPPNNLQANIDNCDFINNSSLGNSGAIRALFGTDLNITNSFFGTNSAGSVGAAVVGITTINTDPRADTPEEIFRPVNISIESTQFQLNSANSQGGAIWTNRISMDVVNSEFYQNIVTADNDDMLGIGGAIGLNGDSAYVVEFNIANNTFIGNLATTEGDQIALFQSTDNPTDITETNLFLANNAFFSFDPDSEAGQVVIENESNGSITSNGGNFFNASVDDFTLDATDIFDEAAFEGDFFVEAEEFDRPLIDLTPLLGTALVDGGVVTSETPTTDRIGLPRDMSPDIGSREIQGTVVDVAVNSGIHNTLVSVLGTAGLVTTLQGDGPFNVFAPTDDAFAAVPDTVLQRIVGDIQNCLTPTLTYHVVGEATDDGIVLSPEIVDGDVETAPTLQGETLGLEANSDLVVEVTHFAGVSNVILANLIANNGVVHVIDEVMVPEAVVNTCLNPNSVEDLQASGIDLTIFPNPVVEELQINALDASIRDFEVSLIDSYGRFLSTYQFGNGSHDIDMSGLPTGNYTLLFIVEGEMYSTQIIKQ